jgi:hypothetical protein
MRKLAVLTLLAVVCVALPNPAEAVDCKKHRVTLDFSTITGIAPIAPYDFCFVISKAVGTLNGTYFTCAYDADYAVSDDVFGDGVDYIYTEKYYSWIETKNEGTVYFTEWGWSDDDFEFDTVLYRVTGGTGGYENAFGVFSSIPPLPNRSPQFRLRGFICTP